ncbi:hypothetical protein TSAR_009370 [Trichomalopsis sarcophagae]|uniref:RNA helicase n=1 Tax=Trichomalopsis sarcophagae TaxID=543379 RepID=A0A232FG16_9HYME|nr:hypothetical protein TSAR_009370 [Trichomalopsis sarcophagae]
MDGYLIIYTLQNATSEEFGDEEYEFKEDLQPVDVPIEKPKRKLIIKCKNPALNFYEGQTYPKFQPIPLASRGWHHRKSNGDYFTIYPSDTFDSDGIDTSASFRDVNLNEVLLQNLEDNNIIHPTSIQKLGIPKILEGRNVILTAETGCGKTFAFLVPLLQQIIQLKPKRDRGFNRPLGLVLTPSRELTIQISKEAKKLAKNLGINIVTLVGGKTKKMMINPPVGDVDLIIATLGVMSKLVTTNIYKMDEVRHVVLDEADTLFDETFNDKLHYFLKKIPFGDEQQIVGNYPTTTQLTLNSATMPQDLPATLNTIIDTASLLPIGTGKEHKITVRQKFFRVIGPNKPMMLLKVIKPKMKSKTPIIIFANTSATCNFASIFLQQFNISAVTLHGDMPAMIRRSKFSEFQNGIHNIMIATDAGARGLDTTTAKDIINFDLPLISAEYVHRCGRIGRIGSPKDCRVINLISRPLEIVLTSKIEFAARKGNSIPMVDLLHNKDNEEGEFLRPDELQNYNDMEASQAETLKEMAEDFPHRLPH